MWGGAYGSVTLCTFRVLADLVTIASMMFVGLTQGEYSASWCGLSISSKHTGVSVRTMS